MTNGKEDTPLKDLDELEIDPDELREAELLALALEEKSVASPPNEALEAAALLRVLRDDELAPDREAAILDDVLRNVRVEAPRESTGFRFSLLWAALGLGALVLVISLDRSQDSYAARAQLPTPRIELLEAQAARLSGGDKATLERELATYRKQVFSNLRTGKPKEF